jgi:hypothetical protein
MTILGGMVGVANGALLAGWMACGLRLDRRRLLKSINEHGRLV